MNRNKNIFHNQKHLTLTERTYIEQELVQGSSFSSIASTLHKDPSTISKEVKRARILEDAGYTGKCHNCMNYMAKDSFHYKKWYKTENQRPLHIAHVLMSISPFLLLSNVLIQRSHSIQKQQPPHHTYTMLYIKILYT